VVDRSDAVGRGEDFADLAEFIREFQADSYPGTTATESVCDRCSGVVTLLPGALIFTGTPAGVGAPMDPPRLLRGDEVVSWIDGIGRMSQTFVEPAPPPVSAG
jgi:hypothetical protein